MRSWILLALLWTTLAGADVIEAPVNLIDFEQNPSKIEWSKIDTEHFELIFPEGLGPQAQRAAHLLEKAYPAVSRSQGTLPPRIALVLQNQSTQSNGFVTLAPRRSEWYVTPAIDPVLTNTEWLKTLSIHEFRHVVQFHKARQGFGRALYIVLGEIGQAVGLGFTMPPWYLEGDAVGMETALTKGGRGRLPLFERDLRTLLLSGKKWDYDKAHLGSYKDYVPNHYVYGYFFTSLLRNQRGDKFLEHIADDAAERSYNPLAFYGSYRRLTSEKFESFYRRSIKELITMWQDKLNQISPTPYVVQNLHRRPGWTNYYYPQLLADGSIFALKYGLSHIQEFVKIKGREESSLFYPAPLSNEYPFKVRSGRVAYLESELDPRLGYRDYMRLRVKDVESREDVLDLRQTKARLAVLNHRADRVLMSEWDEKQRQSIVVTTISDLSQLRLPYPSSRVITSLDWLSDSEIVMVVKDENDLKSLVKFNLESGTETNLVDPSLTNLGFVSVSEGKVFIESPESGIDNIFLVTESSRTQLTSSRFGAYAPVLAGGKLLYNDYSAEGMNIVSKELPWDQAQKSQDSFAPVYEKFAQSEDFAQLEASYAEKTDYPVTRYSQVKNSLNPHSWIILAPPLSNTVVLQAYSRDILNKFALSGGAAFNLNERTTQGFVSAAWSHYYPVFDLRAAYGSRRQDLRINGREIDNKWEEGVAEAGVQVPWTKLYGRFTQNFTLRAFSKVIKVTNDKRVDPSEVRNGALFSPGAEFSYSLLSRLARRDIYSRWGLRLVGHFEEGHNIEGESQRGSIASLDGRAYLPGLYDHHSFFHQFSYEKQNENAYQYASFIYYPRGTRSVFLDELVKYSANYTLPVWYADVHWSSYVYLKRLMLNLFYDELHGNFRGLQYHTASAGWEVLFETNFLRIFLPITFGVRGSYVMDGFKRDNNYEFFLQQALGVF